jgi:hypothetical protein
MRKRQISFAARAPAAVVQMTLARFIPALDEVVVDIRDRGASKLDVDVMVLCFAQMPTRVSRCDQGMWIEIDAAEKGRLGVLAGIDEPGLLMLAETHMRTIPSNAHLMAMPFQQFEVLGGAPKCIALQCQCLGIGPPKDDAHINAPFCRTIEHVQSGASLARHSKFRPHEGDRRPYAVTRRLDGLTDTAESGLAIDQEPHDVATARWIRTGCHKRPWRMGCHRSDAPQARWLLAA